MHGYREAFKDHPTLYKHGSAIYCCHILADHICGCTSKSGVMLDNLRDTVVQNLLDRWYAPFDWAGVINRLLNLRHSNRTVYIGAFVTFDDPRTLVENEIAICKADAFVVAYRCQDTSIYYRYAVKSSQAEMVYGHSSPVLGAAGMYCIQVLE